MQDGKTKIFDNPRDAAEGLREFGIMMEAPKQTDWESALRAAGWQSPRSKSRRTPAAELTHSVEFLLQSMDKCESDTQAKDNEVCGN